MNSFLSHTLEVLSRLIYSLRSICSLRRLVVHLPVGEPAPRLFFQLPDTCDNLRSLHHKNGDPSFATDDTYTSTTSLTDFEEDAAGRLFVPQPSVSKTRFNSRVGRINCQAHFNSWGSDQEERFTRHESRLRARPGNSFPEASRSLAYATASLSSGSFTNERRPRQDRRKKTVFSRNQQKPFVRTQSLARFPLGASNQQSHNFVRGQSSHPHLMASHSGGSHLSSSEDCSSYDAPSYQSDRIANLETELSRLRSQLAQLIVLQEGKQILVASGEEFDKRLDGDGESDAGPVGVRDTNLIQPVVCVDSDYSEATSINRMAVSQAPFSAPPPVPPPPPIPPPPPLPPPPLLSSSSPKPDWRAQLIAARQQKTGNASAASTTSTPKPASMSQVLKELQSGSIKLRAVPRSPGGTPSRAQKSPLNLGSDPCAIIARALKARFCNMRACLDTSGSGSENTPGNSFQDSGLLPDSLPGQLCFETPPVKILSNDPICTPPFGQHLLRPVSKR